MSKASYSTLAIIGGLTAFGLMALMAVIFIAHDDDSAQRLGLFFGLCGVVVTTLVGMLKADQAQKQTNGSLDGRIQDAVTLAVTTANASRRSTDPAPAPDPVPAPLIGSSTGA